MLYEVSFELNGVYCANLVETNTGMETAKEYFIQEKLDGDRSRFCGISEHYGSRKPGMPIHTVPDGWKGKHSKKLVLVDILCEYLTEKNFNADGSPSDDDSYYKIVQVKTERPVSEIIKEVREDGWCREMDGCDDVKAIIGMEDYVGDTLEARMVLSIVGHNGDIARNKNVLVCVYRDTTGLRYDEKDDNNLVYLEVPQNVLSEYMKKHQLPKDWLDIYTADDTIDFFDYAKASIVGIYPA